MDGRVWDPIDWGPRLWPLLLLFYVTLRLLFDLSVRVLLELFPLECLAASVACRVFMSLRSWYLHARLAAFISDWYLDEYRAARRSAGLPFRRTPLPPPFFALPHRYLVLSGLMLSMWSVAMAGFVPPVDPGTWMDAYDSVIGLDPPMAPKRKPSDPRWLKREKVSCLLKKRQQRLRSQPPSLIDALKNAFAPTNTTTGSSPPPVELSSHDDDDWDSFRITTGCPAPLLNAVDSWSDWTSHVTDAPLSSSRFLCDLGSVLCCLSEIVSFDPQGLLSAGTEDREAIVDTGASMVVTPYRDDFVVYEPVEGAAMKGLSAGAKIEGKGVVLWHVDIGGKVVPLQLRAVHIPTSTQRLLSPQQMLQELYPNAPMSQIGPSHLILHLAEGSVKCPYNNSNLPVLKLCCPPQTESLEALHACLLDENNHNIKAAQKELIRWHWKFGHFNLKGVQRILRSGVLGNNPLIKAAAD